MKKLNGGKKILRGEKIVERSPTQNPRNQIKILRLIEIILEQVTTQ